MTRLAGLVLCVNKEIGAARSTAASGGTCKGDLPLRTPQRGSGKSEQSQRGESGPDIGTITSLRQPPPAAPAKDGSGRFRSARLVALTSFGLIAGRCRF